MISARGAQRRVKHKCGLPRQWFFKSPNCVAFTALILNQPKRLPQHVVEVFSFKSWGYISLCRFWRGVSKSQRGKTHCQHQFVVEFVNCWKSKIIGILPPVEGSRRSCKRAADRQPCFPRDGLQGLFDTNSVQQQHVNTNLNKIIANLVPTQHSIESVTSWVWFALLDAIVERTHFLQVTRSNPHDSRTKLHAQNIAFQHTLVNSRSAC